MKKNVIALAVAAAMAAPLAAQAEVSISGGLQAEVASYGGDAIGGLSKGLYAVDGGQFGKESGGNFGYLAFSATEDLGNGMKAIAKYNMNINVGDTNAGGFGVRDAYIGLTGGFGTVLAGTLATPYKSSTVKWDPFLATSLQARGNGGMSDAHNSYASNALAYANKFGPATVVLALVVDEGPEVPASDKTNGKHAFSGSVNVPVGPVEVAVAYVGASKFSNINNLGLGTTATLLGQTSLDTLTAAKVGVKYAAGPITVAGQYESLSIDDLGVAVGSIKPTIMYVTGSYAMGANTVSASYGSTKWDISGVDDTKYVAAGLTHSFSKTTTSTIGYRSTDAGNFGGKETVVSAGLRVKF